jgi:NDP-sugar pyrophosphorylase family protein
MNDIRIIGEGSYGLDFVPASALAPGEDEYRIRDLQLESLLKRRPASYRHLKPQEIEALIKNGNGCEDWGLFRVSDPFVPDLIRNSVFAGLVRLGALDRAVVEHHDIRVPAGITNSHIIACDIGDHFAIHDCAYIAHYIVGDGCLLMANDEIHVSNHAKFGVGILMEGEDEGLRVQLDLMNEAGGRSVLPFKEMTCADAYLWARRREDGRLMEAFRAMTDAMYDHRRGRYGSIGAGCVLKSNRIIKDVEIGESAYVKGANKLKNLSILSSEEERTQIGEGVELVNGIVGRGCRVFYGSKAVRFVMMPNSSLKYGARLIHSVLGDNSTVSCCEMLNNLIFPGHEQHHNTSFLIASLVRGQSNLAAGATIGSNHNSRANDGEIEAGRGFWPGLSTSVKHSSRFASYCLLAKGDYRFELDIALPFCLVDDDRSVDRLVLVPAYWWTHNLYALMRNEGKLASRDARVIKSPRIEFSPFAPDTAEEMIAAIALLELWAKDLPEGQDPAYLELPARAAENSVRPVVVKRPLRAIAAYREMLLWYAAKAVLEALAAAGAEAGARLAALDEGAARGRATRWENLGGQLAPCEKLEGLLERARDGSMRDWTAMHAGYEALADEYPADRAAHAWATLRYLRGPGPGRVELLRSALGDLVALSGRVEEQVFSTRAKDYSNPFRKATFGGEAEMRAVIGRPEDNAFVRKTRSEMAELREAASRLLASLG